MRRWIILSGLAAALALAACGLVAAAKAGSGLGRGHTFAGVAANAPVTAPDFTLTDDSGQSFTLSSQRGQWVLLTYGYTSCPDLCPATLANLSQVKAELGPAGGQVRVIMTTVDPERDTVDVLHAYVHHFGADFMGLTGTTVQVAQAAQAYGVTYQKAPSPGEAGYAVNHSEFVYLLDPQFRLRVTYPFGVASNEITADIQYLMAYDKS